MVPIFGTYHAGRISTELLKASLKRKCYFTKRKKIHLTNINNKTSRTTTTVININSTNNNRNELSLLNSGSINSNDKKLSYFGQTSKLNYTKILHNFTKYQLHQFY